MLLNADPIQTKMGRFVSRQANMEEIIFHKENVFVTTTSKKKVLERQHLDAMAVCVDAQSWLSRGEGGGGGGSKTRQVVNRSRVIREDRSQIKTHRRATGSREATRRQQVKTICP